MKISNVEVRQSGSRGVLQWESDGCRYHIWDHDNTTLYKNSIESRSPGYFRTRHLDQTAKANAEMIAEARRIAVAENLYEKESQRIAQQAEDEQQKHVAAIALKRKQAAAEFMYETLETIAGFAVGNGDVCEIIAKRARAALNKADAEIE